MRVFLISRNMPKIISLGFDRRFYDWGRNILSLFYSCPVHLSGAFVKKNVQELVRILLVKIIKLLNVLHNYFSKFLGVDVLSLLVLQLVLVRKSRIKLNGCFYCHDTSKFFLVLDDVS